MYIKKLRQFLKKKKPNYSAQQFSKRKEKKKMH
jgi:hypothetical protein